MYNFYTDTFSVSFRDILVLCCSHRGLTLSCSSMAVANKCFALRTSRKRYHYKVTVIGCETVEIVTKIHIVLYQCVFCDRVHLYTRARSWSIKSMLKLFFIYYGYYLLLKEGVFAWVVVLTITCFYTETRIVNHIQHKRVFNRRAAGKIRTVKQYEREGGIRLDATICRPTSQDFRYSFLQLPFPLSAAWRIYAPWLIWVNLFNFFSYMDCFRAHGCIDGALVNRYR